MTSSDPQSAISQVLKRRRFKLGVVVVEPWGKDGPVTRDADLLRWVIRHGDEPILSVHAHEAEVLGPALIELWSLQRAKGYYIEIGGRAVAWGYLPGSLGITLKHAIRHKPETALDLKEGASRLAEALATPLSKHAELFAPYKVRIMPQAEA